MLVACDASQLEWRTILQLSQDPVGIAEIVEGQDTHSLNEKAFELPSRLIAKIYLFRTIFRGSGYAFSVDPAFMHVSTDPRYWDAAGEKFYAKYKGIDECHKHWAERVMAGQPLVGPSGRQWTIHITRDRFGNLKVPWTTLTNYPVQGTGADVMMIARISFARRLKTSGIPALLVSTVHDSIVVDVEEKYVAQVVRLMYEVFDDLVENLNKVFKCGWNVPLACEVKIGMNMLDMVKVTVDNVEEKCYNIGVVNN
jgi:DNA polymerase-1